MLVSHSNSSWARLSLAIRRRYERLIAHHIRRAQRWYPDLDEDDLQQEIESAIWMAGRTWDSRRAASMQFSTYLHWHLAKRLSRLRRKADLRCVPETDRRSGS